VGGTRRKKFNRLTLEACGKRRNGGEERARRLDEAVVLIMGCKTRRGYSKKRGEGRKRVVILSMLHARKGRRNPLIAPTSACISYRLNQLRTTSESAPEHLKGERKEAGQIQWTKPDRKKGRRGWKKGKARRD